MTTNTDRAIVFALAPRFGTILILLFAMTGNCSCVGFERDYLGEVIEIGAS